MNYKKIIEEVSKITGKEYEMCTNIVNAYEEYCAKVAKLPFKKEVDETMVDMISGTTNYDKQGVSEILHALIQVVRGEVKKKIPFIN